MTELVLEDRILSLKENGTTTSSVDLSTIRGDMGIRGPQGPAGEFSDLSIYQTEEQVLALIEANLPPSAEEVSY